MTVDRVASVLVNGVAHEPTAGAPEQTLLSLLREQLGLTAAKPGCGEGVCGSCTVLVDGEPVRSCMVTAADVAGRQVTTLEGLAPAGTLHPLQQAFLEQAAFQCGYCTPGMIMSASLLLADDPDPDAATIVAALEGNICRCCAYPRILQGRAARRGAADEPAAVPPRRQSRRSVARRSLGISLPHRARLVRGAAGRARRIRRARALGDERGRLAPRRHGRGRDCFHRQGRCRAGQSNRARSARRSRARRDRGRGAHGDGRHRSLSVRPGHVREPVDGGYRSPATGRGRGSAPLTRRSPARAGRAPGRGLCGPRWRRSADRTCNASGWTRDRHRLSGLPERRHAARPGTRVGTRPRGMGAPSRGGRGRARGVPAVASGR